MVRGRVHFLLFALLGLLCSAAAGFSDPPSVVGRLSLAIGPVSFLPGSMDEWAPAITNYPLSEGDHLWTDQGGRAEIHVGSTAVRLDSGTEMSFLTLDDQNVQLRLSQGSLDVRVRVMESGDTFEIDTPNSVVTLLEPGNYRLDATPDGEVDVTVRDGSAEIAAANDVFDVDQGSTAHISGFDSVAYWVQSAPAQDGWDAWCDARDAREDSLASVRYVPREMIGVEDLDDNGTWTVLPGYGPAWSPSRVPAGWAPYRFGRWAWVAPRGWTWIDDAPWGFTPFHYGRWGFIQARWVWIPGTIVARPVYAPALVVFVGGGSPDNVGWFPLGPREIYVPPYQATSSYVQRINITSVTNITIQVIQQVNVTRVVYVNRTAPSAVTMLPRKAFVQSRPTSENVINAGSDARLFTVIGMGAELTPQRESVLGQALSLQAPARRPPAAVLSRPVFSRRTPAPAPKPFLQAQDETTQTPAVTRPTTGTTQPVQTTRPTQDTTQPAQGTPQPGQRPTSPAVTVVNPTNRVPASPANRPAPGGRPAAGGPSGGDPQVLLTALDKKSVPQAERDLESARKVKGIKLDYEGLKKQIAGIRSLVLAAQKDLKAGRKDAALKEARDAQDQLDQVEQDIADALSAAGAANGSGGQRGNGNGNANGGGSGRPGPSRPTSP